MPPEIDPQAAAQPQRGRCLPGGGGRRRMEEQRDSWMHRLQISAFYFLKSLDVRRSVSMRTGRAAEIVRLITFSPSGSSGRTGLRGAFKDKQVTPLNCSFSPHRNETLRSRCVVSAPPPLIRHTRSRDPFGRL